MFRKGYCHRSAPAPVERLPPTVTIRCLSPIAHIVTDAATRPHRPPGGRPAQPGYRDGVPFVAAAVSPHPPILVPELAGRASVELDDLRQALSTALDRLYATEPDLLV